MKINRQVLTFIVGGGTCAMLDVGLMQLLIFWGTNHIVAATAGLVLGLVVNYIFHANLTFRTPMSLPAFLRYLSLVGINYVLTIGLVSLSFSIFGNALIGKIISLPIIAANGFMLGKHWIFKQ